MTLPTIALEHLERIKQERQFERIFSSTDNIQEAIVFCKSFLLTKGVNAIIPLEIDDEEIAPFIGVQEIVELFSGNDEEKKFNFCKAFLLECGVIEFQDSNPPQNIVGARQASLNAKSYSETAYDALGLGTTILNTPVRASVLSNELISAGVVIPPNIDKEYAKRSICKQLAEIFYNHFEDIAKFDHDYYNNLKAQIRILKVGKP